jgi:aspartyl protease family protein
VNADSYGSLIYLALLLVSVGGWVLVEYRARMGEALRVAAAWGLIIIGLMAGYGLWNDLRGDMMQTQTAGSVAIPRSEDGHYYPRLTINGESMTFMADTGASGIVLSADDAAALGINTADLDFIGSANTANGTVRTARVTLDQIDFGPFQDAGVTAYVTDGQMDGSLLGMDYLGRFDISIAENEMILTR